MNICWYWTRLGAGLLSLICCLNMNVNAPAVDNDIPATEPIVVTESTEPTETVAATEPEILPTEPEIPTESPTEPPVTYYGIPLSEELQSYIFGICEERGIDPAIVFAVIERESDYRDWLMGDSGDSYGLMQVQPKWHQPRMDKLGVTDLLDPYQNVLVGIDYLDELLSYGGRERSIEWTLMAYNGGPDYADRKVSEGIVTDYAMEVINNSYILKGVQTMNHNHYSQEEKTVSFVDTNKEVIRNFKGEYEHNIKLNKKEITVNVKTKNDQAIKSIMSEQ